MTSDFPHPSDANADEVALLDSILSSLARRKCLSHEEAEDFVSWAHLRLVERQRSLLEGFRGLSSVRTYLTTVVINLLRDYRVAKWGKYRPSAAAKRLGTVAVRLEMLLVRDSLPFDHAVEVLRRNDHVCESPAELEAIAAQLPERAPRRFEREDALARIPAAEGAEDDALRSEAVAAARRVEDALREALAALSAEDRLILKLRIGDGMSVADVARTRHLEQKPLYRRIDQLGAQLRREMEARGVRREDIDAVLRWEEATVQVDYRLDEESSASGPSQQEGGR